MRRGMRLGRGMIAGRAEPGPGGREVSVPGFPRAEDSVRAHSGTEPRPRGSWASSAGPSQARARILPPAASLRPASAKSSFRHQSWPDPRPVSPKSVYVPPPMPLPTQPSAAGLETQLRGAEAPQGCGGALWGSICLPSLLLLFEGDSLGRGWSGMRHTKAGMSHPQPRG